MSKQIRVIHIGQRKADLSSLSKKFHYIWVPLSYDFRLDDAKLSVFPEDGYDNSTIFIIENYAKIISEGEYFIKKLPAHRIIISDKSMYSKSIEHIFLLKGAVKLNIDQFDLVEHFLNENYLSKQQGYKLDSRYISIQSSFKGNVVRQGNTYMELSGEFPNEIRQIVTWRMTLSIGMGDRVELYPEFELVEGNIDIAFKVFLIKENTSDVIDVFDIPITNNLKEEKVVIHNTKGNAYINVSLYARGIKGRLRIGNIHIRESLYKKFTLLPGGETICDQKNLKGELLHYFDPGDLQPPLAVYFSGYRPAEGFEGRRMMSSMGCPFILISDPRLEGGSFYMGSSSFENQIVELIKNKLNLLGFDSSQLILSGLSMGTYGALYYASDLKPHSIVIGKPLTDIGDIAINGRIKRPNEFSTALDMLFYLSNLPTLKAVPKINQKFWEKFSNGNYENTSFYIAYMKDDDYNDQSFPRLFKTIKEKNASTKILYKGLPGRHNDNSSEINSWFLKQYRNIMVTDFNREPSFFR